MAKREYRWVRVKPITKDEKAAVALRCERFIAEVLVPRFLPEIRPTEFNYPVGLKGLWRGGKYSFITRYRSGFTDNPGEEFDAPFARFEHDEECYDGLKFHVAWMRHTGRWWPHAYSLELEEALRRIETEPFLQPHV